MQPARHPHNPIHVRSKIQNAHFFYFKGNVQFSWNILVGRALPFFKNGDRTNHDRSMTEVSREQRVEGKKRRRREVGEAEEEEVMRRTGRG